MMIKNIFLDLILIYKNFFFWFKIKFFSFILGIFLGIFFLIPGIIFTLFYAWTKNLQNFSILSLPSDFASFEDNGLIFLVFLNIFLFLIGFFYNYIFLSKFYLIFLKERKKFNFKIFKNFFDFHFFKKYFCISLFLIILLFLIGSLFFFILKNIINSSEIIKSLNYFYLSKKFDTNIILVSIFIFFLLFFALYIFYKISFSYFSMIDNQNQKSLENIKISFKKANFKNFIKILSSTILFLFPFFIIFLPLNNLKIKTDQELAEITLFTKIKTENKISENFKDLELKYFGANLDDLKKEIYILLITNFVIKILNFIIFYGFFIFIYTSIYNNIIKKYG